MEGGAAPAAPPSSTRSSPGVDEAVGTPGVRAHHPDPHARDLTRLSGSVSDHAAERDLHAVARTVEAASERQAPAGAGERSRPAGDRRRAREGDVVAAA